MLRATILALTLLTTTTSAVQLANFQSLTISNAQCRAAYTTNIDGCTASDFDPPATAKCSEACVKGLQKIGEVVKRVCKDVDLGETSIIGVFQNDIGVRAVCPNGVVSGVSSAVSSAKVPEKTSAAAPVQATSKVQSSSVVALPASTLVTSSSDTIPTPTSASVTASASQSEADPSSSTSSQGLIVDPNPTSIAVAPPPPASSTATASPTQAANAQLSNADSGGGSPFDVQAVTGASSQLQVVDWAMAALVGTALLFSACA